VARRDSRIKLCLGNHDYQYLGNVTDQLYSGCQEKHFFEIYSILEKNIDLLKVVYVTEDNYIISHAGVSSWFMNSMYTTGAKSVEDINEIFDRDRNILNFNGDNPYGDDITQSPIWIRPRSLEKHPVTGYNQIVGHTVKHEITEVTLPDNEKGNIKIAYIDTGNRELIYRF
jgi:hypothetical protein